MKLPAKMQDIVDLSFKLDVRHKYHFSDRPISSVYSIDPSQQKIARKPEGLWYSWGGSWPLFLLTDYLCSFGQSDNAKWARTRMNEINFVYKVNIDFKKIKRLQTCKSFKNFTLEFGNPVTDKEKEEEYVSDYMDFPHNIRWKKVARHCHGIDVKFNQNCVFDYHWYEHWDCHSGCVWRLNAIKDLKLIWVA